MDLPKELELKFILFSGILIVLLLATSVIIFYFVYQKKLLAEQVKMQAVQRDYHRDLLSSSIAAQEKERVRIGHELHDGIGSSLLTIKLLFNQISSHYTQDEQIVADVSEILRNTIQDVKNISLNLYPSVLAKFGLVEALHYLVKVLPQASPVEFQLETDDIEGLSYPQELALYRIAQELVNNSIKHAQAATINISLSRSDHFVELAVQDNGIGFELAELERKGLAGIGLKSIEARKEMLQAEMSVISRPGAGTVTTIKLPLNYPV